MLDRIKMAAIEDIEVRDLIVRSRPILLEIVENRGYNMDSYKGVSPEEIDRFVLTNTNLLKMKGKKEEGGNAPMESVIVLYWMEPVKNKLDSELKKLSEEGEFDKDTQELVIILSEAPHDVFAIQAAKQWTAQRIRISFFHLNQIISNPAKHIMVPPHRKLSEHECEFVIKKLKLRSKMELPYIKYHDIQSRVLGLVPGDIVEIRRPSETVGEYTLFRVCTV